MQFNNNFEWIFIYVHQKTGTRSSETHLHRVISVLSILYLYL